MSASTTASTPSEGRKAWSITKFVHPLLVLRDNLRKRFLNRRGGAGASGKDPRVARRASVRRPEGSVPLTSGERKIKHCYGSLNVWYESEDYYGTKSWTNDGTWQKTTKKPTAATIIQIQFPKDEEGLRQRIIYMGSRPPVEYETQARQLLILSENESIQRMRAQAADLGAKQLEHANIQTISDLLSIVGMAEWERKFEQEGVDLSTAFFMRDADFVELGLKVGERIRLNQVLECMRKLEVVRQGGDVAVVRNTRFIKGDVVEHFREADCLIRKGKVVGVHLDDIANGVYYTVCLINDDGFEFQSAERKLDWPGEWEKLARSKGLTPIFKEGDGQEAESGTAGEEEAQGEEGTEEQAIEESQVVDESAAVEEYADESAVQEEAVEEVAQVDEEPMEAVEETEEEQGYSGRGAPPPMPYHSSETENAEQDEQQQQQQVEGEEEIAATETVALEEEAVALEEGMDGTVGEEEPPPAPFPESWKNGAGEEKAPALEEAMPVYAGRNRMGSLAARSVDSRNPSMVSTIPMLESEEMLEMDDGSESGMGPPPAVPGDQVRRPSATSSRSGSVTSRSGSVYSQIPMYEVEEMVDDGDNSGMNKPPPPVPHRSDSIYSEEGGNFVEEAALEEVHSIVEDDEREGSGMPPPPPIPSSRSNSITSSLFRRDSSSTRRDSASRRVSFTTGMPPPPLPPSASSPRNPSGLRRASSAGASIPEEVAIEEMEPMEMQEEVMEEFEPEAAETEAEEQQ